MDGGAIAVVDNELTEEERAAIKALRELDRATCEPFDDEFLSWFVLSRKLDVGRSLEVLKNHIQWRKVLCERRMCGAMRVRGNRERSSFFRGKRNSRRVALVRWWTIGGEAGNILISFE